MAWCFSTRASVATVLTTHSCVSRCLRVNLYGQLYQEYPFMSWKLMLLSVNSWYCKYFTTKVFFRVSFQSLTLSIWLTCPSCTWFWKFTRPANIFTCPANICTSPVKLMYTAGKISTCPYWKITCPFGHVTAKVQVPWDKIYVPRACGHALTLSPVLLLLALKTKNIILTALSSLVAP